MTATVQGMYVISATIGGKKQFAALKKGYDEFWGPEASDYFIVSDVNQAQRYSCPTQIDSDVLDVKRVFPAHIWTKEKSE